MKSTDSYRKLCLKQQIDLRRIMMSFKDHHTAIQLFLRQHAMLHSARMANTEPWSFEDDVFNDLTNEQIRQIPQGDEHSIAWLIWHSARCEDITMNLLVAGNPQIMLRDAWLQKMKIKARDTGNTMSREDIIEFSTAIDIDAMRAYRLAVGRETQKVVKKLHPGELKQKVEPSRLQRVMDEGAVVEAARGIVDYWSKRNIAGLLLMPATRHNLTHLNEALTIKHKLN
jgi:hypothetical protein